MPESRGMLTLTSLESAVQSDDIDTILAVFTDLYGRFVGKRFDADFFLESIARDGTHGCDYLLTVDMEMEPISGYAFANWEKGYGDFHLVPDLSTLRRATWLDRTAIVICDVLDDSTHDLVPVAPRSLLRQQLEVCTQMGYEAFSASELEYYLFSDSFREAFDKGYMKLDPAGWYIEDYHALQGARTEPFNGSLRRHLRDSGVAVENTKGEWGLGQHELNIRYTPALEMADRHCIYKQCAKELADSMGMSVSFMAKYDQDSAGSSCHVHVSLWKNEKNAFFGGSKLGPISCSDVFKWFLGGWIEKVPELMVFYAPTVNSYKRYQSGSWAPTSLAWSHDNRTAGFRVVGSESSLRIECRIPGADCNPYLVYTAALASGLAGIRNRIEPPPIFEGDAYNVEELPQVPKTLEEATENFSKSSFARETFGDFVVDHYTHFFKTEYEAFQAAVTDWERKRYFERI